MIETIHLQAAGARTKEKYADTFVGLLNLRLDLDVACILERCHDENFHSILHPIVVLH